jgi:hypothetical protein
MPVFRAMVTMAASCVLNPPAVVLPPTGGQESHRLVFGEET